METIMLEHHPNDSRLRIAKDDICQTLNQRMGTGGGNVPMVLERNDMDVVRRLTPLECTRLQGYPDYWLNLPPKTDMTDEELSEWNAIRQEMAAINGKNYKTQTKDQMLKWYNKMIEADSNKYKALGNSIALPQWWWLVCKMADHLPDRATMGSLFDGIGGFPLVWEERHGEKTARWASEIEPYPIAVTKCRFEE